jgi:hypothetical protein
VTAREYDLDRRDGSSLVIDRLEFSSAPFRIEIDPELRAWARRAS